MKTVEITIANKRIVKKTDKGIVFSVDGYNGGIFTIPFIAIESQEEGVIPVNDVSSYEAVVYVIHRWLYEKIKGSLDRMSKAHFTMPNR